MSDRGIYSGFKSPSGWRDFTPNFPLIYTHATTTPTQPALGDLSGYFVATYRLDELVGRVEYKGVLTIPPGASLGSGDQIWNLRMPYPADRNLGGADQPTGTAWCRQASVGNQNMRLFPVMSDPEIGFGLQQTDCDYFSQFFIEHMISSGTGSIASGASSTTINHNLGTTPNVNDLNITVTNKASSNPQYLYVDTITATQFTVHASVGITGGTAQTFSWRWLASPTGTPTFDLLVNQLRPFGQWAAGDILAWSLDYQARV